MRNSPPSEKSSDGLLSAIQHMLELLSSSEIEDLDVIEWASPIPYFGNPAISSIATLGLNPSNREFVDIKGTELKNEARRFETLSSLNISGWDQAERKHIELIQNSCTEYFFRNPYDGWFRVLDKLISGTGTSFYSPLFHACHLDLIPYATSIKWANLKTKQKNKLLKLSGSFLGEVVNSTDIRLLILNGKTVVENFSLMADAKLEKIETDEWRLPRNNGTPVKGFSYAGTISEISGLKLNRALSVIGFNHNIQSSFGVTSEVRNSIQSWITLKAQEVL